MRPVPYRAVAGLPDPVVAALTLTGVFRAPPFGLRPGPGLTLRLYAGRPGTRVVTGDAGPTVFRLPGYRAPWEVK